VLKFRCTKTATILHYVVSTKRRQPQSGMLASKIAVNGEDEQRVSALGWRTGTHDLDAPRP
jgi:hypothetical protein